MGIRETRTDECDWCRKRVVGLGHMPAMDEVVVRAACDPRRRQVFVICIDCHKRLERLISRLGRGERTGAIR